MQGGWATSPVFLVSCAPSVEEKDFEVSQRSTVRFRNPYTYWNADVNLQPVPNLESIFLARHMYKRRANLCMAPH